MKRARSVLIGLAALLALFGPLAGVVSAQSQGIFIPLLVYPAGMGMGDVKLAALLGAA